MEELRVFKIFTLLASYFCDFLMNESVLSTWFFSFVIFFSFHFQLLEDLSASSSSLDKPEECQDPDSKEYWVKKCLDLIAAKNAAEASAKIGEFGINLATFDI